MASVEDCLISIYPLASTSNYLVRINNSPSANAPCNPDVIAVPICEAVHTNALPSVVPPSQNTDMRMPVGSDGRGLNHIQRMVIDQRDDPYDLREHEKCQQGCADAEDCSQGRHSCEVLPPHSMERRCVRLRETCHSAKLFPGRVRRRAPVPTDSRGRPFRFGPSGARSRNVDGARRTPD